jgi:hypothetical protein
MINKIKQIAGISEGAQTTSRSFSEKVYRPERPLGFVSRTDPNFYFYSKR